MNGVDVTRQITGGQIGANLTLRDVTLPTDQAELDEFSQNLASRFNAQGLTLFTDPAGNVPSGGGTPVQSGYVGFANTIQVNPDVLATPSLVRDGTPPSGGPAGSTDLIMRVLNYTFGSESAPGVPQLASQTGGLGPGGTLSAPYTAPATLAGIASSLVSAQAADSARTSDQLTTDQAVQASLQSKLTATTGVSVDSEMALMVQLQNAYSANARVISAAEAMWSDLIGAVTPTAI
jgi:flagellar hook-associated protein 1 FlgK